MPEGGRPALLRADDDEVEKARPAIAACDRVIHSTKPRISTGLPTPLNPEHHVRYAWAAQVIDGGRVLDAACGGGRGTALLAQSATEAIGVDFSPAAIADARRDHGDVADFREGDLRDLPFGDGEFDHVVCFEAIAHLAEPEPALDQLRRVLRAGGVLLVSSPNAAVYPPGNPLHLSQLAGERLERLLAARFARVAVHRQQSYFASLLGPGELLAHDDPSAEVSARVAKLSGGPPGSELHAVAAASDGELPPPPAWIALGGSVDWKRQQELLEEWQERAVQAEAQALALSKQLRAAQR
jgi:SAM-dependent methyltransferase